MNKNRQIAYTAAALNALIWGAALPLVKPALEFITPHQFLFLRYALAAACTLPLLIVSIWKQRIPTKKLPIIIFLEVFSMTVLFLIYLGLQKTAALQASFIVNTAPIFTTLAGIFILKEKEEKHEWIGLSLAVTGTTMLLATPLLLGEKLAHFSLSGNGLVLLAIIIDVARILIMKKAYKEVDKIGLISISSLVGFLYFGTISLVTNSVPTMPQILEPSALLAVIYMGTVGTLLAFTFQFIAYTRIEASEAVLFTYLQPLVYLPLAVIWLHDTILPTQLIGLALIALGVFTAEKRSKT